MKKIQFALLLCICVHTCIAQDGQRAYYEKAKVLYLQAASKTKCPERARYLRQMAEWNQCMMDALAGKVNSCPEAPSSAAPPCDADEAGGTLSGRSPATAGNSLQNAQAELNNAKNVSMTVYQQALNNGGSTSGALLNATLAGAQQISDPSSSLVYTGVGLGLSLFSHIGEKKARKREMEQREAARQEEEEERLLQELEQRRLEAERKTQVITAKNAFIREALNINRYTIGQLLSKERYASLLLIPKVFTAVEQSIYFTLPVKIPQHSDSTYPLGETVRKTLVSSLRQEMAGNYQIELLYPITDIDKFTNEFVRKMGSGKVISLDAGLLEFAKSPYGQTTGTNTGKADFWTEPAKKEEKKTTEPVKKQKNFWDQ